MKLQPVLLEAMAKKMRWWDAAEIIGVTVRTMRRWRERRLADRRRGKPSDKRVPLARGGEVPRLPSGISTRSWGKSAASS